MLQPRLFIRLALLAGQLALFVLHKPSGFAFLGVIVIFDGLTLFAPRTVAWSFSRWWEAEWPRTKRSVARAARGAHGGNSTAEDTDGSATPVVSDKQILRAEHLMAAAVRRAKLHPGCVQLRQTMFAHGNPGMTGALLCGGRFNTVILTLSQDELHLPPPQLYFLLAHELAHAYYCDTLVLLALADVVFSIALAAFAFPAHIGLLHALYVPYILIALCVAALVLYSRFCEARADLYGGKLSGRIGMQGGVHLCQSYVDMYLQDRAAGGCFKRLLISSKGNHRLDVMHPRMTTRVQQLNTLLAHTIGRRCRRNRRRERRKARAEEEEGGGGGREGQRQGQAQLNTGAAGTSEMVLDEPLLPEAYADESNVEDTQALLLTPGDGAYEPPSNVSLGAGVGLELDLESGVIEDDPAADADAEVEKWDDIDNDNL